VVKRNIPMVSPQMREPDTRSGSRGLSVSESVRRY
jgi:hypothetical protein